MNKIKWLIIFMTIFSSKVATATESNRIVVLELFTSQSCSSCPAADSLLRKISDSDAKILPLSFHVDYWDHLSWKDTYSSPVNTERQRAYAAALNTTQIFTPQLIINGAESVVGSNSGDVKSAIEDARKSPPAVNVSLSSDSNNKLAVNISVANSSIKVTEADILEVQFDRYAKTNVTAGENGGRTLESINNVKSIALLGELHGGDADKIFYLDKISEDGVAIIVQMKNNGKILGGAYYMSSK